MMHFLLALASVKRVRGLHSLSYEVKHAHFAILPEFVAKIQKSFVPDLHFEEFNIPSLRDFVDEDK